MHKIKLLVILLALFNCSYSQLLDSMNTKKLPNHPRILFLGDEEKNIRQSLLVNPELNSVHLKILSACDTIITRPLLKREVIGKRLLSVSREALRRIFFLSYAYRISGDAKYLNYAEKELNNISEFLDWNPSHFLDVAEMTMAASIGYDWLYNSLSEITRNKIKNAIIEKGLKPSLESKYNSWLTKTHNWNQVCNAGMTFGSLAVFEDVPDLSLSIINRAITSIQLSMQEYEPDGNYPEGYGYWDYGTSFNVMFIDAIEKAFSLKYDLSKNNGFLNSANFILHMNGPSGKSFNYSDNSDKGKFHIVLTWFANRIKDNSLLWFCYNNYLTDISIQDRLLPAFILWGKDIDLKKINPPFKKMYTGRGKNPVALMRTSWLDKDAIYVGIKAGTPKASHGHMDIGSFVIDAKGERWVMDFGPQDYNSLESKGVDLWNMSQNSQRWKVFRYNNFAHNTISVNNQLQKVDGFAPVINVKDTLNMMSAVVDLSSIYQDQLREIKRVVTILDSNNIVVRDEFETLPNKTNIRWNLLTSAQVNIVDSSKAYLIKNNKTMILKVVEPIDAKVKTWSTVSPNDYDAPNPSTTFIGFEYNFSCQSKSSIEVVLSLSDADEKK